MMFRIDWSHWPFRFLLCSNTLQAATVHVSALDCTWKPEQEQINLSAKDKASKKTVYLSCHWSKVSLLTAGHCNPLVKKLISPTSQATIMLQSLLWFSFYSPILRIDGACVDYDYHMQDEGWWTYDWHVMMNLIYIGNWPVFKTCNILS